MCILQTKRLLTSVSDSTCTLLAEQSVLVSTSRCTELRGTRNGTAGWLVTGSLVVVL